MSERFFNLLPGRTWTACLWALAAAGVIAAFDFHSRLVSAEADELRLLLLPREATDEASRQKLAGELRAMSEIRRAAWLAPQELAQATAAEISGSKLAELFSSESAWLPWVLEVSFASAAANEAAIERRIASLREAGPWRLVLWDDASLHEAALELKTIRFVGGLAAAVALLTGALALAGGPRREGPFLGEAVRNVALFALLGGGLLAVVWGRNLADDRASGVFLGAGFALAALAAPMLKGRALPKIAIPPQE